MAATSGHLFVVRGRIGELVADAAIVTTDSDFRVEPHWNQAIGVAADHPIESFRPPGWPGHGWARAADQARGPIWFLNVRSGGGDIELVLDRLSECLAEIAGAGLRPGTGRPVPLVVLPVIGINRGGFAQRRGEVVRGLLETCLEVVRRYPLDIAIVATSAGAYGALQHFRRAGAGYFDDCTDRATARSLGAKALDGSLALFIGAGVSIPAGLPSWGELIEHLAGRAQLTGSLRDHFERLGALDQAELLHLRLGSDLASEVKAFIGGPTSPAIAHALLAALGCQAAVTTNYDDLYERAMRAVDDAVIVVLPDQVPSGSGAWLLKLHGSLAHEESIVLTRSQFVGYDRASAPSGAILQALMLTKHLLVLGTSMTDDNVLRLIHEVAAFRDQHESPGADRTAKFGTILDVSGNSAREVLHEKRFAWIPMPGERTERPRELEIFLDAVSAYAVDDASWLLDERFNALLPTEQRGLAADFRDLAYRVAANADRHEAWNRLGAELRRFGAS